MHRNTHLAIGAATFCKDLFNTVNVKTIVICILSWSKSVLYVFAVDKKVGERTVVFFSAFCLK